MAVLTFELEEETPEIRRTMVVVRRVLHPKSHDFGPVTKSLKKTRVQRDF